MDSAQKIVKWKKSCNVSDIPINELAEMAKRFEISHPMIQIVITEAPPPKEKAKKPKVMHVSVG